MCEGARLIKRANHSKPALLEMLARRPSTQVGGRVLQSLSEVADFLITGLAIQPAVPVLGPVIQLPSITGESLSFPLGQPR